MFLGCSVVDETPMDPTQLRGRPTSTSPFSRLWPRLWPALVALITRIACPGEARQRGTGLARSLLLQHAIFHTRCVQPSIRPDSRTQRQVAVKASCSACPASCLHDPLTAAPGQAISNVMPELTLLQCRPATPPATHASHLATACTTHWAQSMPPHQPLLSTLGCSSPHVVAS